MSYITSEELAKLLGYKDSNSIRWAIKRGVMVGTKIGKTWFFTPTQVRQNQKKTRAYKQQKKKVQHDNI